MQVNKQVGGHYNPSKRRRVGSAIMRAPKEQHYYAETRDVVSRRYYKARNQTNGGVIMGTKRRKGSSIVI
jgi:hypothetical protein